MNSHDILHNISEKSDADQSNLWHSIAHQIEEENLMRKSKSRRLRLSTTWAVAVIGILLMSSAIFGRAQRKIYHAVTLTELEQMATPLDLVETNNDLTIQLDWAYADATQVVVAYTLFDLNGEPILARELEGEGRVDLKHVYPENEYRTLYAFFPQGLVNNPDSAQQVIRYPITGTYLEALNEFLEQGFDINTLGMMNIELRFFYNPPTIRYTPSHLFEFEIPFGISDFELHNDLVEIFGEWDRSEELSDFEFYFNDFVIADSSTHLFMCIRIPDDIEQRLYFPRDIDLYANNRLIETIKIDPNEHAEWTNIDEARVRYDANYYADPNNPEGFCVQFKWYLAFDELPQTIHIEIPMLTPTIDHALDNPISQTYVDLFAQEGYLLEYLYNEEYDDTSIVYPLELDILSASERHGVDRRVYEALYTIHPLDERLTQGWEYTIQLSPESEE